MHLDNVFGASSGFGKGDGPILYDWSLSYWVQILDGLRGKDGISFVEDEIVRDV